jgi:hypothetical protein
MARAVKQRRNRIRGNAVDQPAGRMRWRSNKCAGRGGAGNSSRRLRLGGCHQNANAIRIVPGFRASRPREPRVCRLERVLAAAA